MNARSLGQESDAYLRALAKELAGAPVAVRDAALDDVRAHLADALEGGRSPEEALSTLGTPQSFAQQYRDELRVPEQGDNAETAASATAARALHLATVFIGLLAGAFMSFILRSFVTESATSSSDGSSTGGETVSQTLAESLGAGFVLLAFVPALLALLPLVLPAGWRRPVALANAVVMTGFSLLGILTIGGFYLPVAVLMWSAVIVPWRVGRGLRLAQAPIWRAAGAVVIAAPVLLLGAGALSGSLILDPPAWFIMFGALVLAVLFAIGLRITALVTAVAGVALMVFSMFDPGLITLGIWVAGGLYAALGISSYVAWGTRKESL